MFGKSKNPSPPAKCKRAKNSCKLCFSTVTAKTGIQCQGACKKWIHYKCLSYTPGKIQDIKKGYIQVKCPCPNCDTREKEKQVKGAPYFCGKSRCHASAKPVCQTPVCPKNNPIPGSSKHACPDDCTSTTGVNIRDSSREKIKEDCVKSLQRCHSPKDRSQERRRERKRGRLPEHPPSPVRDRSLQCNRSPLQNLLRGLCLKTDLSSECRFLKDPESTTRDVQDTSRDYELTQPQKQLQEQCRSPLRDISLDRGCRQEREMPLEHRKISVRERSSERDVCGMKNRPCIQKTSSDVTADQKRNHAIENLVERRCAAQEKIPRHKLQQHSLEERLLKYNHSTLKLPKCTRHSTGRRNCARNHNPTPEKVLTDEHSPLQQSSVECFPLSASSSGSKYAQHIKCNSEAQTPDPINRRLASKEFGGQTTESTFQSPELSSYELLKRRKIEKLLKHAILESKRRVTGQIVNSPDSIGRNVKKIEDFPIYKTASLIRRILNSKDIQFPSIHKKANTACLEFSQNMPSFRNSECRQLYKSCSIETITNVRSHNLIEVGVSSELKSMKLCKSDSFLLGTYPESRNIIFNTVDHILGTVDQVQNQIRELMGKAMDVFKYTL